MTREDLIKALNLQGVDQAKQDEIIQNALIVVEHRVSELIDELLSDEQAQEFNEIVEKDDPEIAEKWLRENVPKLSELYDEVLRDYAEELRGELCE